MDEGPIGRLDRGPDLRKPSCGGVYGVPGLLRGITREAWGGATSRRAGHDKVRSASMTHRHLAAAPVDVPS